MQHAAREVGRLNKTAAALGRLPMLMARAAHLAR